MDLYFMLGYTELMLQADGLTAFPQDWERRLIAAKHYAQELLDVTEEKSSDQRVPESADVRDLCAMLQKHAGRGKSLIQIARDFTHEKPRKDRKARSLLRQAQRYPHLWKSADK